MPWVVYVAELDKKRRKDERLYYVRGQQSAGHYLVASILKTKEETDIACTHMINRFGIPENTKFRVFVEEFK